MSRRWCFTLNNYTEDEAAAILDWTTEYLVVGDEVGESGTRHLQGFVIFKTNNRLSACKKLQPRAHWEITRGSAKQAADYCKKDGAFEEFGTCPDVPALAGGESNKERWSDALAAAKRGDFDSIPADIRYRYYRVTKEIAKDHLAMPDDLPDCCGVWLYGPPGVGKSHKARADYPEAYLKLQNKWWDGYQMQDHVIMDDFDCKELGHFLKIWADKYAFLAETKGGTIAVRPKTIVVTSNYSIDEIEWKDDAMRAAIARRFKVIHMPMRTYLALPPSC